MKRKMTNNEFLNKLRKVHPNYTALEPYKDCKTKITIECNKGHIFKILPSSITNPKVYCKYCNYDKLSKKKRLTKTEFLTKLHKYHPNWVLASPYLDYKHPVTIKCEHNHTFKIAVPPLVNTNKTKCPICKFNKRKNSVLQKLKTVHPHWKMYDDFTATTRKATFQCNKGHIFKAYVGPIIYHSIGCPQCKLNKISKIKAIPRSNYEKRLKQKHPNWKIKKYKNITSIAIFECPQHHIFKEKAESALKRKQNCPVCTKIKRTNHFKNKFYAKHPTWKIITPFKTKADPITVKCNYGHVFTKCAINTLNDICPICEHLKQQKDYINKIHELHPKWQLLSKYQGNKAMLYFKCEHGHIFQKRVDQAITTINCPQCKPASSGELYITNYLKQHNIKYISPFKPNSCKDKNALHFDFKIKNILIEYQGLQHYQPIKHFGGQKAFIVQQKHDQIKRDWAIEHGYREIEIRYDQNINDILDKLFNNYKMSHV